MYEAIQSQQVSGNNFCLIQIDTLEEIETFSTKSLTHNANEYVNEHWTTI